jgi:hypothetical protein
MTKPKQKVVPAYGEGDTEAKAMADAAQGRRKPPDPDAAAEAPPPDTLIPAAGTTETDIAKNLREKASRESKS